jgi:hypothetical protein
MADMQIAPGGMIVGTVRGRDQSGGFVRDYNRHAIVLLDGWLHHMAQNVGDPTLPWYRMHGQDEPGFAQSDFPAPLVVSDYYNTDRIHGYDTLVVKDGVCRRWRYTQSTWSELDEPPIFNGVIGAPELVRRDDLTYFGSTTYDAYLPTKVGLFRFSYHTSLGWLPREIITNEVTGWPSVTYIAGECIVYANVDGVLRAYTKTNDQLSNWVASPGRSPQIPCNGAPAAVTMHPRIGFKGDYPYIEYGQVHLVVPSEKGIIHFWTNQQGEFDWDSVVLGASDISGAALVAPIPAITEGYAGWEKVGNVEALLMQKRDALQQRWIGDTREWAEPSFAF